MIDKSPLCAGCPMEYIGIGFVPFELKEGPVLMVGEAPGEEEAKNGKCFVGGSGRWLKNIAASAGYKWDDITLTNCLSCQPPANVFPTDPKCSYISRDDGATAVRHCASAHLWPNLTRSNKSRIFAIGGQALTALTGKYGINQWRGSVLPLLGSTAKSAVIATIHPAALMRQAKLTSVVVSDLRKSCVIPPENYNLDPTEEDLLAFDATKFAFDFEWGADGNITLCGLSDRFYTALVVPFTSRFTGLLKSIFERATALIGHNIVGADMTYFEKLGWQIRPDVLIEDTMLKQHLVQPDYPHDLAFVASVFTNKVFWKGKGWDEDDEGELNPRGQQWRTWDKTDAIPRSLGGYGGCTSGAEAFALYNARDTDAEFQINTPLDHLLTRHGIEHIYRHVSLPVAYICRDIGERGIRLDTSRLAELRAGVNESISGLEGKLPVGLAPYYRDVCCNVPAPEGTYRPVTKTCKGTKKAVHVPWTSTFSEPGETVCPTCGKAVKSGKMVPAKVLKGTRQEKVVPYNSPPLVQKYVDSLGLAEVFDHKTGRRTTGKKARKIWGKDHPEFAVLGALKQQVTLRNNFAKDSLLGQERMFFNLKVHGTSEGRLSSSGKRRGIDLNIQNQPNQFRVIYVADKPGDAILNLDIVQGENWLTAWIAKDWERWERLQDPTYDEHSALATSMFGQPIDKARTKSSYWSKLHPEWEEKRCQAEADYFEALRQIGKKINHGGNYGMGVKKQKEELELAGFDKYTEADVKEFIALRKKMNRRTTEWQAETIEQAKAQGYLRNAFGRPRWFTTRAIATECLAFLPASTLADMVLRMMMAHYPDDPRIYPSIVANGTEVFAPLSEGYRMATQVHDSLVFMGPDERWKEQAGKSKAIMEQPFPELNNFHFRCEVKYGTGSWGEVRTVEI